MTLVAQAFWWLIILGLGVVLDVWLLRVWWRYRRLRRERQGSTGGPSRWALIREAARIEWGRSLRWIGQPRFWLGVQVALELALIAAWALFVGRDYLNMDPRVVPAGREFSSAVQTHHFWTRVQECGLCALWNGSERGGYPALADVHGSLLHPLVALTTLAWGVVNGAKIALVISFWVAGVAQWWLARTFKLGMVPRLWSAAMAVVGGHLTGRMELGAFGVVLSTAMCSLVFAAALAVARGGGRRIAIVLGVVTASALLSGQGYIQVGLIGLAPALVFLMLDEDYRLSSRWRMYAIALGLALLLAAPFLLPFLHFSPNFVKETDPSFSSAQSLAYLPLNLVIDDWAYYNSEALGKLPYPHLYALFIGWTPVFLAFLALGVMKKEDRRAFGFLVSGIVLEFLIGSAVLLKPLAKVFPSVAGVRHPSQIAGLAVPLILALSAYGLDYLLKLPWPEVWLQFKEGLRGSRWKLSTRWLLVFPLLMSMEQGYRFSQMWVYTVRQTDGLFALLEGLRTESLQWVNPPFGEHPYIEPAVGMGLKLSPGILSFRWEGRADPIPVREANRAGLPPGPVRKIAEIDGVLIYARLDQPYAAVERDGILEPCTAEGTGGMLTVVCRASAPGRLIVREHTWTGWKAWRDGQRVALSGEQWLEVKAPAGNHTFQFRYQPWDVLVGLAISLAGVILTVWLWCCAPSRKSMPANTSS